MNLSWPYKLYRIDYNLASTMGMASSEILVSEKITKSNVFDLNCFTHL